MKKLLIWFVIVVMIVSVVSAPVYAYLGSVQTISEAALALAKKEAVQEAIAIAAAAGGGVATRSLAVKVITSGLPWVGLGLTLGMIAYDVYYSSQDLNALNTAVAGQAGWSNPAGGGNIGVNPDNNWGYGAVAITDLRGQTPSSYQVCGAGVNYEYTTRHVRKTAGTDENQSQFYTRMGFPVGNGWSWSQCGSPGVGFVYEYYGHWSGTAYDATEPVYSDGIASQTDIQNWFTANPSSALNPDNRGNPVGQGGTSQPADDVTYLPLSTADVSVTQKNVSDILPDDIVLGDGFPPVAGSTSSSTAEQITTRDTVVDPVTGQEEITENATATCTAGSYDNRSMGDVLYQHVSTWQSTPLLSSLNNLAAVTFTSTLPVVSFPSSIFGTNSIDFNDYSWFFVILKVLMIGVTTLYSYKIVFGG